MKLVVFFFSLLSAFTVAATERLADQHNIVFTRIGTSDGLSQGLVTAITQSPEGLIWVATQEGLNSFDGYEIKSFYHIDGDSNSLSSDYVWALLFDSQDRFWVGTSDGLDLFNVGSNQFQSIDIGLPQPFIVYSVLEDSSGMIWIGTSEGLVSLDQSGLSHSYSTSTDSSPTKGIRVIFEDSAGRLWVGTDNSGLYSVSVNDVLLPVRIGAMGEPILSDSYVRDINEDSDGNLWIATYNGGVSVYNPSDKTTQIHSSDPWDPSTLRSSRVRALYRDQNDHMWVGTDAGLHLWLAEEKKFQSYQFDITDSRSLSDNTIYDIFQDAGGVVWVGTFNGISKWNANLNYFPYFRRKATNSAASSNNITSFAEDGAGDLWIGTFTGLLKWDLSAGELVEVDPTNVTNSEERIMSLGATGDDIWVGTIASGIKVLRDGKIQDRYFHRAYDPSSLSSNAITSMFLDSRNRMWVSTYGGGVNLYLGDGNFRRFPSNEEPDGEFSDLRCLDIEEDSSGTIWVATDGGGVILLDPDSGRTKTLTTDPLNNNSIVSNNNFALLKTDSGMWVGSLDKGLSFIPDDQSEIQRISKKDGLASDSIYGLVEDDIGRIWTSGGRGISMIQIETGNITNFDQSHGLQSSDFNSGAFLRLSDGSLAFGGNNGFNAFDPLRIRANKYIPPVRITRFELFNKAVNLADEISDAGILELNHDDTVMSFKFAALDYTAPEKNTYRYKLVGFDREWVQQKGNREATYTNLDSGRYVFMVQGSNNDGLWNEVGTSLEIHVQPAPWLTWWAYLIYLSIAVLALYLLLRFYMERQKIEAERQYSEQLRLYIESLEEASDCILIANSAGDLVYANNAIRETLNKSPNEVIGQSIWKVLFQDQADVFQAQQSMINERRYHGEVQFSGKDVTLTHEVTIAAVQPGTKNELAYVGISRDITRRKITEAELADYRKNLEIIVAERTERLQKEIAENKAIQQHLAESLKEKELLIKEVHHRVKNNMQVISSLLSIQAEGSGDDVYAHLLNESQQRIKSMALIHETLYQSKDLLKIDFQDYIDTLTVGLRRSYATPGASIEVNVKVENVSLDLETAVPCGLIINELVSNALKHAFKGRKGRGQIDITFKTVDCSYELKISDDGIGLPIGFDPGKSTSMGLEIVSILTTQLEGRLEYCSEQGSVFKINFPGHKMLKHRILVVEDEVLVARDIQSRLCRMGYEVIGTAGRGEEAVSIALDKIPDLILMDINLRGDMDGIEASLRINEKASIPVIFCTAYSDDEVLSRAKITSPFGYVLKPFDNRELEINIEIALFKHKVELDLANTKKNLDATLTNVSDGVIAADADGKILLINPVAEKIIGQSRGNLLREPVARVLRLEDFDDGNALAVNEPTRFCFWKQVQGVRQKLLRTDGRIVPIEISVNFLENDANLIVLTFRDITQQLGYEEAIQRSAFFDGLTELPNRALFVDRLDSSINRRKRGKSDQFAVLFVGLDGFAVINEGLGHEVGDQVINEVARRITRTIRPDDTVSRFSGDVFAVLLDPVEEVTGSIQACQRILNAIQAPLPINKNTLNLTASVGITVNYGEYLSADDMVRDADTALHRAKSENQGAYTVFDNEMYMDAVRFIDRKSGIQQAIIESVFKVFYQPIVDAQSGRLISMEALVRWPHPVEGMISPVEFIPIAEATGLIMPLGEFVLRTVCDQIRQWQDMGFYGFRVAVNFSARQFEIDVGELVKDALACSSIEPTSLTMEITEGLAMKDVTRNTAMLHELNRMGVSLSMDDFGTGYSSLSYLKRFPLTTLKIDRSFIKDITDDQDDQEITRAIIAMGQSLKLKTLAEGVETVEQLRILQGYGCDYIQGYYFSKPLPCDEMTEYLQKMA